MQPVPVTTAAPRPGETSDDRRLWPRRLQSAIGRLHAVFGPGAGPAVGNRRSRRRRAPRRFRRTDVQQPRRTGRRAVRRRRRPHRWQLRRPRSQVFRIGGERFANAAADESGQRIIHAPGVAAKQSAPGGGIAAAQFEGGIAASTTDPPGTSPWNAAPEDRLASRPLYGQSPGSFPGRTSACHRRRCWAKIRNRSGPSGIQSRFHLGGRTQIVSGRLRRRGDSAERRSLAGRPIVLLRSILVRRCAKIML